MSFPKMRKKMVEEGFLDQNGQLTAKGHEYVEQIKRDYRAKTLAAERKIKVKERISWPTNWK